MRVAVHVLLEVAVDAVHAALGVHVLQVHRLARLRHEATARDRRGVDLLAQCWDHAGELVLLVVGDDRAVLVEQVALAVHLEDRAEDPAVAVVVGELRVLELRVDLLRDAGEERTVSPLAARRRPFRVAVVDLAHFLVALLRLRLRPHVLAVGLVRPHLVAVVGVQEAVRLVHVADHAGARRDRAREAVRDRVAALVLRDRRIDAERLLVVVALQEGRGGADVALAEVAELREDAAVHRIAVVGVDDVAGGAAAAAEVAGAVVGAEERQVRVVQARLVHVQRRQVDAVQRAEAAVRRLVVRATRVLELVRQPGHRRVQAVQADRGGAEAAALLEDAEHVARLRDLPVRQRQRHRRPAVRRQLLGGRQAVGLARLADHVLDQLRRAVRPVRLAEDRTLGADDAVGVGDRAPEVLRRRHQRLHHAQHFVLVARTARLVGDAQVARVDELDPRLALAHRQHVGALGIGGVGPTLREARLRVRADDVGLAGVTAVAEHARGLAGTRVRVAAAGVAADAGAVLGVGAVRRQHQVGRLDAALGALVGPPRRRRAAAEELEQPEGCQGRDADAQTATAWRGRSRSLGSGRRGTNGRRRV